MKSKVLVQLDPRRLAAYLLKLIIVANFYPHDLKISKNLYKKRFPSLVVFKIWLEFLFHCFIDKVIVLV